jgi:hypothetical protein
MGSTNAHAARGIARVLDEFGGRRSLDQRATEPARKANALAVDRRARVFPNGEGFRVVPKIDPDLFEDGLRILLDRLEALFTEDLVGRELAGQVRGDRLRGMCAGSQARFATARASCGPRSYSSPVRTCPERGNRCCREDWYISNILLICLRDGNRLRPAPHRYRTRRLCARIGVE